MPSRASKRGSYVHDTNGQRDCSDQEVPAEAKSFEVPQYESLNCASKNKESERSQCPAGDAVCQYKCLAEWSHCTFPTQGRLSGNLGRKDRPTRVVGESALKWQRVEFAG